MHQASRSSEQRLVDIFPVIFLVYPYFCIWSATYKGRPSRSRTRPQPSWWGWWGTRRGRRWPPWQSPSCSPDRDQDCQQSTEFLNFDIALICSWWLTLAVLAASSCLCLTVLEPGLPWARCRSRIIILGWIFWMLQTNRNSNEGARRFHNQVEGPY